MRKLLTISSSNNRTGCHNSDVSSVVVSITVMVVSLSFGNVVPSDIMVIIILIVVTGIIRGAVKAITVTNFRGVIQLVATW